VRFDIARTTVVRVLLAVVVGAGVCAAASTSANALGIATQFARVSVSPGPRPGSYSLRWAAAAPTTGDVFDVQITSAAATRWTTLVAGTTTIGRTFAPTVPGPYAVRARLRSARTGQASSWSPAVTLSGNWPMFQAGQARTGIVADPTIGASTAPRLTVKWKTLVGSGAGVLASPAVAFNTQLHKPLVFAATTTGTVTARDLATGAVVWVTAGNGPIVASPAVVGNSVYVGTESHYVFAFDAATGAVQCAFSLGGAVVSSPVVAQVDRTGPVVFFGDVGAGVADSPGHVWAMNGVGNTGAPCTRRWDFDGWNNAGPAAKRTGTWSPPALTIDSLGRPLLIVGSSDPDDSVYALDARTGTVVWRFQTKVTAPDQDVGAAPTISRPGIGGFGHGVVYIDGKDNIEYALDLLTGHPIWSFDLQAHAGGANATAQSAAALVGNQVVVPYARYVFSLDARTGVQTWRSAPASGDYFSSPSVSGSPGDQVILIGDDAGVEHAYRVRDGTQVLELSTSGAIYASDAVAFAGVVFGTTDGYLYALG